MLDETALEPRYLELELTETCAMDDAEASIEILNDLKQTGVTLAIDDFGTGYSCLSYLKRFPIQKLKIDKSLVRDITSDANDAAIAASTIALAKVMNLNVTAEGVETEGQSSFLQAHGCDEAQGFLYGHPVAAKDFAGFFDGSGWLH